MPVASELAGLVDMFCEGDLAPQQAARLEALVADSSEARQYLLDCFQVHCELAWDLGRESEDLGQPTPPDTVPSPCSSGPALRQRHGWKFAATAVALLVAITLGLSVLFRGGIRQTESHPASVARIGQEKDVQWSDETAPAIGAPLPASGKLAVRRGLLEVVFDGGAKIIVQGPAELELQSPSSAFLLRGALTADVPAAARGFAVHTSNATIVDLGTRFGVACQDGQTDVEVFAGKVLLRPAEVQSGGGPQELSLVANSAARVSGVPGDSALKIEQLAVGSRPFVQSMTESAAPLAPACACPDVPQAAAELLGPWHSPAGKLVPIDLGRYFNSDKRGAGDDNPLDLAAGTRVLAGVEFQIGDRMIQLQGQQVPQMPPSVEGIPVQRRIVRLYILHATQFGTKERDVRDGELIAEYRVRYADRDMETVPVVVGQDVRDWWAVDRSQVSRSQVAWAGSNKAVLKNNGYVRLYLSTWQNPHPEKTVACIDYVSMKSKAAPFCVAITAEEPPAARNGASPR
jgi:hypothetical protein